MALSAHSYTNTAGITTPIALYLSREGQFYFRGADVARSLQFVDIDQAIRKNVDDEFTISWLKLDNGQHKVAWPPHTIFLSEYGLYDFMLRCKKPEAALFKHFVYGLVQTLRTKGSVQLADAQQLIDDLRNEQKRQQHDFEALLQLANNRETQIATLSSALDEATNQLSTTTKHLTEANKQLVVTNNRLDAANSQLVSTTTMLQEVQAQHTTTIASLNTATSNVLMLTTQLNEARTGQHKAELRCTRSVQSAKRLKTNLVKARSRMAANTIADKKTWNAVYMNGETGSMKAVRGQLRYLRQIDRQVRAVKENPNVRLHPEIIAPNFQWMIDTEKVYAMKNANAVSFWFEARRKYPHIFYGCHALNDSCTNWRFMTEDQIRARYHMDLTDGERIIRRLGFTCADDAVRRSFTPPNSRILRIRSILNELTLNIVNDASGDADDISDYDANDSNDDDELGNDGTAEDDEDYVSDGE